jgi:uncharacterized protein YkwD
LRCLAGLNNVPGYPPTDAESVFLGLINQARANPAAYGASLNPPLDLSAAPPIAPLVFDTRLIYAARLHSQWMRDHDNLTHNENGVGPGSRIAAAGFPYTFWAESIAGDYPVNYPELVLSKLIVDDGVPDLGHRRQLLGMDIFQRLHYVGVGIAQDAHGVGWWTIDTASAANPQPSFQDTVFITNLYRDILGRDPEPSGLAYWLGVIASQGRKPVVDGILRSLEARSVQITQMYQGYLRREPDQAGLLGWVNSGLDITAVLVELLRSDEYYNRSLSQ